MKLRPTGKCSQRNPAARRCAAGAAVCLVVLASVRNVPAQTLDKGHRIILERGLQLQGMVINYDLFHLSTFQNANCSTVNWIWDSYMPWLGPGPGVPWARWARNQSEMPPLAAEVPYASNLVGISLGDEQDLNDPTVRANTAAWFAAVRANYPNTILYCNSWGGQITNPNLEDFINTSHPDMLSFDTYPFTPTGPTGGSPTNLYGDMQRYRKFGLAHGLPYAMYTQTFHDSVTRDPSESELRLDYFAGLGFGYTYFACFVYNMGATSLFSGPGDTNPKLAYGQLTEIQRRARLLGPTLTRLVSTDVRFINGQHRDPSSGATVDNATPIDILHWQFGANDPYLRGWVVTNVGTKNDGLRGDVVLSWFKPLDESFDGPCFTNEIYFMVTNGLTAMDGSAADCRQDIKLNFLFDSGITALQHLRQDTGAVEVLELPILPDTGGRRQLDMVFDGGTGELFKFNTGAPFIVSSTPPDPPPGPVTGLTAARGYQQITLSWTNPTDADFTGVLIRRKLGSFPSSPSDGELVLDKPGAPGAADSFVDTGLTGTATRYYAAFAHDCVPNYAAAATVAGTPAVPADFDLDGDVDQDDFGFLQRCLSGENQYQSGCDPADLSGDGKVNTTDFSMFLGCMAGPNQPPGC